MNPFKYRPEQADYEFADAIDEEFTYWEDNAISNAMAWASVQIGMDQYEWPSKVTNWMWTDCATCLAWRGIAVGFFAATVSVAITLGLWAVFTGA